MTPVTGKGPGRHARPGHSRLLRALVTNLVIGALMFSAGYATQKAMHTARHTTQAAAASASPRASAPSAGHVVRPAVQEPQSSVTAPHGPVAGTVARHFLYVHHVHRVHHVHHLRYLAHVRSLE